MQVKNITLFFLLLLPFGVFADSQQAKEKQPVEELPGADLLEFIAEFEHLDGQWIDPIQLNMIFAENRNSKDNEPDHN
jgi:hypothetical protein